MAKQEKPQTAESTIKNRVAAIVKESVGELAEGERFSFGYVNRTNGDDGGLKKTINANDAGLLLQKLTEGKISVEEFSTEMKKLQEKHDFVTRVTRVLPAEVGKRVAAVVDKKSYQSCSVAVTADGLEVKLNAAKEEEKEAEETV